MALPDDLLRQFIDAELGGATLRVGLLDTSTAFTFDSTADTFVSDLPTGAEPADGSYARQTLSGVSITVDNTDNEGVLDAADVTFPSLSTANDIQAVFVYKQVGGDDTTPGDDRLVAVYDDDSAGSLADLPISTNGSDITLSLDAEGLINLTAT
jgi:hypothetical protein